MTLEPIGVQDSTLYYELSGAPCNYDYDSQKRVFNFGDGVDKYHLRSLRNKEDFQAIYGLQDTTMLLNHFVSRIEKPLISVGAGNVTNQHLGLLVNSNYGVSTENCRARADYVYYGLVPDSGLTYHFSRLKHNLGFYYLLTGQSMEGADLTALGLTRMHTEVNEFYSALENALQLIPSPERMPNMFNQGGDSHLHSMKHKYAEEFNRDIRDNLNLDSALRTSTFFAESKKLVSATQNRLDDVAVNREREMFDYHRMFDHYVWDHTPRLPANGLKLAAFEQIIDEIFSPDDFAEVKKRIAYWSDRNLFIKKMGEQIAFNSALAVETTFYMLKRARNMSFTNCLEMECMLNKKLLLMKNQFNDFIHFEDRIYNSMMRYDQGFVQRLFNKEIQSGDLEYYVKFRGDFDKVEQGLNGEAEQWTIDVPQVQNKSDFECLPNKDFQDWMPEQIRTYVNGGVTNNYLSFMNYSADKKTFLSNLNINPNDCGIDNQTIQEKLYILKSRELIQEIKARKAAQIVGSKVQMVNYINEMKSKFDHLNDNQIQQLLNDSKQKTYDQKYKVYSDLGKINRDFNTRKYLYMIKNIFKTSFGGKYKYGQWSTLYKGNNDNVTNIKYNLMDFEYIKNQAKNLKTPSTTGESGSKLTSNQEVKVLLNSLQNHVKNFQNDNYIRKIERNLNQLKKMDPLINSALLNPLKIDNDVNDSYEKWYKSFDINYTKSLEDVKFALSDFIEDLGKESDIFHKGLYLRDFINKTMTGKQYYRFMERKMSLLEFKQFLDDYEYTNIRKSPMGGLQRAEIKQTRYQTSIVPEQQPAYLEKFKKIATNFIQMYKHKSDKDWTPILDIVNDHTKWSEKIVNAEEFDHLVESNYIEYLLTTNYDVISESIQKYCKLQNIEFNQSSFNPVEYFELIQKTKAYNANKAFKSKIKNNLSFLTGTFWDVYRDTMGFMDQKTYNETYIIESNKSTPYKDPQYLNGIPETDQNMLFDFQKSNVQYSNTERISLNKAISLKPNQANSQNSDNNMNYIKKLEMIQKLKNWNDLKYLKTKSVEELKEIYGNIKSYKFNHKDMVLSDIGSMEDNDEETKLDIITALNWNHDYYNSNIGTHEEYLTSSPPSKPREQSVTSEFRWKLSLDKDSDAQGSSVVEFYDSETEQWMPSSQHIDLDHTLLDVSEVVANGKWFVSYLYEDGSIHTKFHVDDHAIEKTASKPNYSLYSYVNQALMKLDLFEQNIVKAFEETHKSEVDLDKYPIKFWEEKAMEIVRGQDYYMPHQLAALGRYSDDINSLSNLHPLSDQIGYNHFADLLERAGNQYLGNYADLNTHNEHLAEMYWQLHLQLKRDKTQALAQLKNLFVLELNSDIRKLNEMHRTHLLKNPGENNVLDAVFNEGYESTRERWNSLYQRTELKHILEGLEQESKIDVNYDVKSEQYMIGQDIDTIANKYYNFEDLDKKVIQDMTKRIL